VRTKERGFNRAHSGQGAPLKVRDAPRVQLTKEIRDRLFAGELKGDVSEVSAYTGLPYGLIYNLVHGRIRSLSIAEYRRLFGEDPPSQEQKRVNGDYFRGMVKLWVFLNDGTTEKDLYREFYSGRRSGKKIDYRIFSGATKTVETRIEKAMEEKFLSQGLDRLQVMQWVQELDRGPAKERVPYEAAKPVLRYLQETLGTHPSRLLRRGQAPYEKGKLKTISKELYGDLLALRRKSEKTLASGSRRELETLKEEVYGKRKDLVLFSEVEEDLEFLQKRAGRGAKKYLARSAGKYRRSVLKRIALRRAEKIREDCDRAVNENQDAPLRSLPSRHFAEKMGELILFLRSLVVHRMIAEKSFSLERVVMDPAYHPYEEYESGGHGFVTLQEAAAFLGMKQKAFDLLVAAHRDVFMRIMRYEGKWLIPDLYLKELSETLDFALIRAKYESLAKRPLLNMKRRLDRSSARGQTSGSSGSHLEVRLS
jgi:hypothetical protein